MRRRGDLEPIGKPANCDRGRENEKFFGTEDVSDPDDTPEDVFHYHVSNDSRNRRTHRCTKNLLIVCAVICKLRGFDASLGQRTSLPVEDIIHLLSLTLIYFNNDIL